MKNNFGKYSEWLKKHLEEVILVIGVILISLFSFATGYIVAKYQEKKPIKIEYESSNHWWGNNWSLFSLETFRKRG